MGLVVGTSFSRALLFSVVLSSLSSFGFILNDIWDVEIDRVNRPQHFEDLHFSELWKARWTCIAFGCAPIVLSFFIGWAEFGVAILIGLGLIAYTVLLRRFLLLPNVLAAVLASSPLWSPIMLWSKESPDSSKLMFLVAIIAIITAREILMDTRDIVGDTIGGRDTVATLFNERIASFVGVIITLSACVPLVLCIITSAAETGLAVLIASFAVALSILYLLVPSVLRTVLLAPTRPEILTYVTRSRWAMALIPFLVVLLWYR
ncbi:MAG: UbiA family prenyltransferase [Pyrinomonadaceae bacterium]